VGKLLYIKEKNERNVLFLCFCNKQVKLLKSLEAVLEVAAVGLTVMWLCGCDLLKYSADLCNAIVSFFLVGIG